MASINTVFGVRIVLDKHISDKPDIGIYSVENAYSEIRLSETVLNGVAETWTPNLICDHTDIIQKADFAIGGGVVHLDSVTLTVINTNQFSLKMQELGVNFNGLKCEIIEFEGTDEDADSVFRTVRFTGTCEDTSWGTTLSFIVKSSFWAKRRASLSTNNTGLHAPEQGAITPIVFGNVSKAKIPVSFNLSTRLSNSVLHLNDGLQPFPIASQFPVTSIIETNECEVQFAERDDGSSIHEPTNRTGSIVAVVEKGDGEGCARVLKEVKIYGTYPDYMHLLLWAHRNYAPQVSSVGDNVSWVALHEFLRLWKIDNWPILGIVDNGGALVDLPHIYVLDGPSNYRLLSKGTIAYDDQAGWEYPSWWANRYSSLTDKRTLTLFPEACKSGLDSTKPIAYVPARSIELITDSTLSAWGFASLSKVFDGFYKESNGAPFTGASFGFTAGHEPAYAVDNNETTYAEIKLLANGFYSQIQVVRDCTAVRINMPDPPAGIEFTSAYIVLEIKSRVTAKNNDLWYYNGTEFYLKVKKLGFAQQNVIDEAIGNAYWDAETEIEILNGETVWRNDCEGSISDNDSNDDYENVSSTSPLLYVGNKYKTITGHVRFKIPNVSGVEDYLSISGAAILLRRRLDTDPNNHTHDYYEEYLRIYKAGISFESSANVSGDIYADVKGRIINDFWDSDVIGVSPTHFNIIDKDRHEPPEAVSMGDLYIVASPGTGVWEGHDNYIAQWTGAIWTFYSPGVNYLRWVIDESKYYNWNGSSWVEPRRQNNSVIENPIDIIEHALRLGNWSELGVAKDWGHEYSPSLINTASFDAARNHEELQGMALSRQITNENNAWNDEIVKSLCSDFYLVSRQDENGYECVDYLHQTTNPATIITLADILGDVGDMIEPSISDVFVEPKLKYAYDIGSNNYTGIIEINNVAQPAWQAAYTPGLIESHGEVLWEKCHALWLKYRQIEPTPDSLVNQKWIKRYDDAVWKLTKMIDWMCKKRTSFQVSYKAGRSWHVGKHVKIKLKHQTNNYEIECVIEEVRKNKNKNSVKVRVVLLTAIPTAFFFE